MGSHKKVKKFLNNPIAVSVTSAIIISIISAVLNGIIAVKQMDYRLENLEKDLEANFTSLQTGINDLNEDLSENKNNTDVSIKNIEHNIGVLEGKVSVIENSRALSVVQIDSSGELGKAIRANYQSYKTVQDSENKRVCSDFEKFVETDVNTKEEYSFSDLQSKTIIMSYKENGEDVYFKGQLDKNGYWDGNCIINRYNGEKLTMIMDAVYNSGSLSSYKQVFPYITGSGDDVWVFSIRKVEEEDVRSGETWMFFRNEERLKEFEDSSFSDTSIINTEKFINAIDLQIEGYYNGYTSEGKFNDTSEDAYMVKYKENGDVRYLYVGQIKDGVANDSTGNAWSLSWGYANDGYYYYKGIFYDGDHDIPDNWQPIPEEQIDNLINPDNFNCSLKGLIDEDI